MQVRHCEGCHSRESGNLFNMKLIIRNRFPPSREMTAFALLWVHSDEPLRVRPSYTLITEFSYYYKKNQRQPSARL